MAVSEDFKNFVQDQLSSFGEVEMKKMFGGIGIFHEGLMFGMVHGKEGFKLKVDDHNKKDFEDRGMAPLFDAKKKKGMPYWDVPVDVLEDSDQLKTWAQKAYTAALRAKKK